MAKYYKKIYKKYNKEVKKLNKPKEQQAKRLKKLNEKETSEVTNAIFGRKKQKFNLNNSTIERTKGNASTILGWILCFLLVMAVVRTLQGYEPPTFRGFMEMITSVPDVTNVFSIFSDFTIKASWGAFNFLRDFINLFAGGISVIVYLIGGVIQIILFVLYFIKWIFI